MRGRDPPKIPPPSGRARRVAPDPVIGKSGPRSVRPSLGRTRGGRGRRSLTPRPFPTIILTSSTPCASQRVNRGTFRTGTGTAACVAPRRGDCKRTSKNTKNDASERLRDGRSMPGKASVTRSVRIEKDADERLRQLAEQGDTSGNTLVNRALRKFVKWDAYRDNVEFSTLTPVSLVKLMDCLSDEEARELGVW